MGDKRYRNASWIVPANADGTVSFVAIQVAVLMDVRDELQKLNRLLACPNFTGIPATLRDIRRNTTRRKRARKGK